MTFWVVAYGRSDWIIFLSNFQDFHSLAVEIAENCENLVFEQKLQQKGWAAVVANLESTARYSKKKLYSTVLACISRYSWLYATTTSEHTGKWKKGSSGMISFFIFNCEKAFNSCGRRIAMIDGDPKFPFHMFENLKYNVIYFPF